ncbi:mucin-2-like [Brassica napus]|uniref:mucin-2-like n=1 Tax=Brassica napus TaxID=3708 RepID=UPI0006AA86FA|nr:mucin-2-like [Brassica napus]
MQNVWQVPGRVSGLNPLSVAAGDHPDPTPAPPDPPDPSSPISPQEFPPLNSSPPTTSKRTSPSLTFTAGAAKASASGPHPSVRQPPGTRRMKPTTFPYTVPKSGSTTTVPKVGSETTVPIFGSVNTVLQSHPQVPSSSGPESVPSQSQLTNNLLPDSNPIILPPKNSPLLKSNLASSSHTTTVPPPNSQTTTPPQTLPISPPLLIPNTQPPPIPQTTLVERLCASEDKTLRRLAPVTVAPSGRPRVLIPDSVFQKGAEIHKDFIICYFNGRPPPFIQIQSVFNHL